MLPSRMDFQKKLTDAISFESEVDWARVGFLAIEVPMQINEIITCQLMHGRPNQLR